MLESRPAVGRTFPSHQSRRKGSLTSLEAIVFQAAAAGDCVETELTNNIALTAGSTYVLALSAIVAIQCE